MDIKFIEDLMHLEDRLAPLFVGKSPGGFIYKIDASTFLSVERTEFMDRDKEITNLSSIYHPDEALYFGMSTNIRLLQTSEIAYPIVGNKEWPAVMLMGWLDIDGTIEVVNEDSVIDAIAPGWTEKRITDWWSRLLCK